MKTKHLFILGIALASQFLYAQTADNKVALGLNLTRSEYNGDYGNAIWDFNQHYFGQGFGLSLATYLNSSFDLGLQGNFGEYGYYKNKLNRFVGDKLDLSLFGHYKLNNGYIFSEKARLSPFISMGIGYASYSRGSDDDYVYPRIIVGKDLIVPIGAGLKWQIANKFALQYQYLYNFTNHDNHDEIREANYPGYYTKSGNDAFGQHMLSMIFSFGKARDTDKDGIADKFDRCPDTPIGVDIDDFGCPIDTDGDGIADYLDKCPLTPDGVNVDASGCPIDSDKDGIADYLDKCSDTPNGVKVDASGCPIDSDKDGVADHLDKCPGTAKGIDVDAEGCPLDRDGDGVPDYLDKCPDVAGLAANKGCPEIKSETKKVFSQAIQGIQFELGSDVIKKASFPILDKVVSIMKENPAYNLEIKGYTDNKGNPEKNMDLSQRRADAVLIYLITNGIEEERLISKGFGQNFPVADNETATGRAKNRRVEFNINF